MSKPDYFSEFLQQNWATPIRKVARVWNKVDTKEYVAPLDLFRLVRSEIYLRSIATQSAVLIMLAGVHCKPSISDQAWDWGSSQRKSKQLFQKCYIKISAGTVIFRYPERSSKKELQKPQPFGYSRTKRFLQAFEYFQMCKKGKWKRK